MSIKITLNTNITLKKIIIQSLELKILFKTSLIY